MFEELISRIALALKKRNIPYMIIGGHAAILYGEPRLTRDIDITLGTDTEELPNILEITSQLKLKPIPDEVDSFAKKTMVLPVIDPKSRVRVDFIFSFTPYEQEALKRVNKVKVKGVDVSYASCEDVIIHKIFAQRPRDLEDVKIIIIKNPDIDKNYIEHWLSEFDKTFPDKKFTEIFKGLSLNKQI